MSRPERRSQPRFPLDRMVVRSGTLRALVVDLSLDGLALRSERPLPPGRTYRLSLGAPGSPKQLVGTVVWCSVERIERRATESVPIYRAGLRLRGPRSRESAGGPPQAPEPSGPSSPRSTSRCRA